MTEYFLKPKSLSFDEFIVSKKRLGTEIVFSLIAIFIILVQLISLIIITSLFHTNLLFELTVYDYWLFSVLSTISWCQLKLSDMNNFLMNRMKVNESPSSNFLKKSYYFSSSYSVALGDKIFQTYLPLNRFVTLVKDSALE